MIGAYDELGEDKFTGKEQLTMFADYRVPQVLRHLGIMEYSEALATKIDNCEELSHGGSDEIEIRAATVVAVERILAKISEDPALTVAIKHSYEVDWLLWQLGEKTLDSMKEHHRV